MRCVPVHKGIVIVDIEGSGALDRTNLIRIKINQALQRMFGRALRSAGIKQSERMLKGLGDGVLALFDARVPTLRLIHPLVPHLVAQLDEHNRDADERARIRVRMVVHTGDLVPYGDDFIGEDLNHAFRLIDSDPVRACLAANGAPLVLVVSQRIHDGFVRQEYEGIRADEYIAVRITAKETKDAPAWIWGPPPTR